MDPRTPPHRPEDDDEILSLLTRLERFLVRVLEGIFKFFLRIPRWTADLFLYFWSYLEVYLGRLLRITIRLGRVILLTGLLGLVVVGPGLALYYYAPPLWWLIWSGVIVCAVVFGVGHYVRREYERRKQERLGHSSGRLACAFCRTLHAEPTPPVRCPHCEKLWVGVEI